jgi:hypothetical protein
MEFDDRVFFREDTIGELFVRFQHGVNSLVNGALGEAAHPEQALFQLVYVSFEVAFHSILSSKSSRSCLAPPPALTLRSFSDPHRIASG